MTKEEIYQKANSVKGLGGMTGNERLWESDLMDEYDRVRKIDKYLARTILEALKFDEWSINRMVGHTLETLKYPNPWNFPDQFPNELNNEYKAIIKYQSQSEIAQGGPISSPCELIIDGREPILIHNWCGGQPVWNWGGLQAAIPIWQNTFWKGTIQKIGILDISKLTLAIYKKSFRVLDLRTFNKNLIEGYDSPIHKLKFVEFDINKQKPEQLINLK